MKDPADQKTVDKVEKELTSAQRLALAQVGFKALIDEATGYQEIRFKDPKALQKMLKRELKRK